MAVVIIERPTAAPARSVPAVWWAALRPKQWVKNLLVFAVPLAAGRVSDRDVMADTVVAFVCFCAAASATYLVNDVIDRAADREHPTKCARPVASGELSVRVALALAVVLGGAAVGLAVLSTYPALALTLVAYLALTLSYSLWLKHEPVIEMALVAGGFLLRAIAGGAASGIPISPWFLIVASFGSLFVAAGKRYSELARIEVAPEASADPANRPRGRRSLDGYTLPYLRFVSAVTAAVTITAYCLWALQVGSKGTGLAPLAAWSVAPFVLALLRYGVDIDAGGAESPEETVLHDRLLLVIGIVWAVMLGLGSTHL